VGGSVTLSTTSSAGYGPNFVFSGTENHTLRNNNISALVGVSMEGTGTLSLLDNGTYLKISHTAGTLTASNVNVSCDSFSSSGNAARTLNMGSGTWAVTGGGASWACSGTNLTLNPGTSTVTMTRNFNTKTFAGGGKTYNILNQGGTGVLTVTGNNTFANITNTVTPCSVLFAAGSNNTFAEFSLQGVPGGLVTIGSPTAAQHTLTKSGAGLVQAGYCSISYSNATPANTWYAAP
jgi:hypothetical protein